MTVRGVLSYGLELAEFSSCSPSLIKTDCEKKKKKRYSAQKVALAFTFFFTSILSRSLVSFPAERTDHICRAVTWPVPVPALTLFASQTGNMTTILS